MMHFFRPWLKRCEFKDGNHLKMLPVYSVVMAEGTSGIHHVAHAYANPIVVSVSSATG